MSSIPCNEDLDKIYTKMEFQLGELISKGDKVYQFIQYNDGDGDVDGVAGRLVIGLDTGFGANEVTMDYSSTVVRALPKVPRGFLQAALTHATFGFIQTWGPNRKAMLTDGGVAQGDVLMKHASIDGAVDTRPPAETGAVNVLDVYSVGQAREADVGTALGVGYGFITIRST